MTTTIPAPGTEAAVRGKTPYVQRAIDGDQYSVVVDFASPELAADILKAIRENPTLRQSIAKAVESGHGFLMAHAADMLAKHLSRTGASTWTLTPVDAEKFADDVMDMSIEPDGCSRSGCPNLAEDGGLCAAHRDAADALPVGGWRK